MSLLQSPRFRVIASLVCIIATVAWISLVMSHRLGGEWVRQSDRLMWRQGKPDGVWLIYDKAGMNLQAGQEPTSTRRFWYAFPPHVATAASIALVMTHRLDGDWVRHNDQLVWKEGKPYGDWFAFYKAAAALKAGQDPVAASGGWYIYPPFLATAIVPLTHWDATYAAWLWLWISMVGVAVTFLIASLFLAGRLKIPRSVPNVLAIIAVTLLLSISQTRWEFEQSQTDWLVLLGYVIGMACMDRFPWMCGMGLGMAANIKYISLAALPYLLIRRRWSAAAWTLVGCGVFAYGPALYNGWEANNHVLTASLERLAGIDRQPEGMKRDADFQGMFPIVWHRSISIPSAAARVSRDAGWGKMGTVLMAGAVAGLSGLWVLLVYRRQRVNLFLDRSRRTDWLDPGGMLPMVIVLEWLGVMLASLVFSPQMITRHTFIFMPVLMLPAAMFVLPRRGVNVWLPLFIGLIPTIAAAIAAVDRTDDHYVGWPNYWSIRGWGWLLGYLCLLPAALRYFRTVQQECSAADDAMPAASVR